MNEYFFVVGCLKLFYISPKTIRGTEIVDKLYDMLRKMPNVSGVYALSGEFDALAVLQADTTAALDEALDQLGRHDAVERTQTSIVLSVKFER